MLCCYAAIEEAIYAQSERAAAPIKDAIAPDEIRSLELAPPVDDGEVDGTLVAALLLPGAAAALLEVAAADALSSSEWLEVPFVHVMLLASKSAERKTSAHWYKAPSPPLSVGRDHVIRRIVSK